MAAAQALYQERGSFLNATAAGMSRSGTCYVIKRVADRGGSTNGNIPGTWFGRTTTAANCTGMWALTNTTAVKFP